MIYVDEHRFKIVRLEVLGGTQGLAGLAAKYRGLSPALRSGRDDVCGLPIRSALAAAEGVADGSGAVVGGGVLWLEGLLAPGVEDDEAAGAIAGGGGGQAGLAEGQVKQAALAGVHRREGVGPARGADSFHGGFGDQLKLAVAEELEVFGVEGDAVVLLGFEAEDLGGEVLDSVEEFGVAGEEDWGVGAGEFDGELGRWLQQQGLGWRLSRVIAGEDLKFQFQSAGGEQGVEELSHLFDLLVCRACVVDWSHLLLCPELSSHGDGGCFQFAGGVSGRWGGSIALGRLILCGMGLL